MFDEDSGAVASGDPALRSTAQLSSQAAIDPKTIKIASSSQGAPPAADRQANSKPVGMAAETAAAETAPPAKLELPDLPHPPRPGQSTLPCTLNNLEYLLDAYGIRPRFDVVTKQLRITTRAGKPASLGQIASLAHLHNFGTGWLQHFLSELGHSNPYNPIKEWIESKPWDEKPRLQCLCETVVTVGDYPEALKNVILSKWLTSATAAALASGPFKARGVLTLQGAQGIGKTSWIASLLPYGHLRSACIKLDHHMDGSKDAELGAIGAWITELGELDGSFRKDVARLKGFLTRDADKIRPPYGKEAIHYPRRTVFAATVNEGQFLVDPTGNGRFWTASCEKLHFDHQIDMQQVFAELAVGYHKGAQWWLTLPEEQLLSDYNARHRTISAIAERVRDYVDPTRSVGSAAPYRTATELLGILGVRYPTNVQAKECGAVLRELLGEPKRVKGRDKWRVAERLGAEDDDDDY